MQENKQKGFKLEIKNPIKKKHIVAALATVTISAASVIGIDSFFDHYDLKFQSPIIFQSPVLVEKRINNVEVDTPEVEIVPEVQAKEVEVSSVPSWVNEGETISESAIASADNKWILWRVYRLESSAGQNDGCKYMDKFNGYGYRQNKFEHICFDSFEEVTSLVDAWFTKQLKTKTIEQALCWYNEGREKDSCEYSNKFMNL